jgi:hypothetical protein
MRTRRVSRSPHLSIFRLSRASGILFPLMRRFSGDLGASSAVPPITRLRRGSAFHMAASSSWLNRRLVEVPPA